MAEELFIPKLGQTVEEVTLVGWLVEDGARVEFGVPVLEVETDKAVFPVEANANGYLHRGPFSEGEVIPVLTVVATIGKADELFSHESTIAEVEQEVESQPTHPASPTPSVTPAGPISSDDDKVFISPRAKKLAREKNLDISGITPTGGDGIRIIEKDVINYLSSQPKATPVASNMAAQAGIDLAGVPGSGPRGTVTKADVEQLLKTRQGAPIAIMPTSAPGMDEVGDITNIIPIKGVREIIFNRMGTSVHTTARVTLMTEVDATAFVEAREQLKSRVKEEWGFAPGYNDLLAIMVAKALSEYPFMNARLKQDGTAIEWIRRINLGMAVDTDRGLLVPVIHDADKKGLRLFGTEFREKVERARSGRALPDDLSGGTFTITNLGMYDIDAFTPVINLPELAILGVGRIIPKPVVYAGDVTVRQMMVLSLVFDHRLVDGAPAARFLQRIKNLVETPYLLLG
jgi:pyruvate dehydrogenase E2 component (dihydrolipoamide acetyltransferase)